MNLQLYDLLGVLDGKKLHLISSDCQNQIWICWTKLTSKQRSPTLLNLNQIFTSEFPSHLKVAIGFSSFIDQSCNWSLLRFAPVKRVSPCESIAYPAILGPFNLLQTYPVLKSHPYI